MLGFKPKTLLATASAVILPLLLLVYIASLPGKRSAAGVVLQVAIVVVGLVLFGLLLAKLLEQMNSRRVGRWLESPEGRDWLEALSEEEREAFLSRYDAFR